MSETENICTDGYYFIVIFSLYIEFAEIRNAGE